jgi:hypothetical protein
MQLKFFSNLEDKWDGYETGPDTMGNPWYICTVAVPHVSKLSHTGTYTACSDFLT